MCLKKQKRSNSQKEETLLGALQYKREKTIPMNNSSDRSSSFQSGSVRSSKSAAQKRDLPVRYSSISSSNIGKKNKHKVGEYRLVKKIGSGSFAKVFKCKHKKTKRLYAIKSMNKRDLQKRKFGNLGRSAYDAILDELKVLKMLEHPNVIWLEEIIDDVDGVDIHLVTDFHTNGSLGDVLRNLNEEFNEHNENCRKTGNYDQILSRGIDLEEARGYFIDMLRAMHYCHNIVKILHKDIKPDNIVIG